MTYIAVVRNFVLLSIIIELLYEEVTMREIKKNFCKIKYVCQESKNKQIINCKRKKLKKIYKSCL